jgi:hypothetical protein
MRSMLYCTLLFLVTPWVALCDNSGSQIDGLITIELENDGTFSWSALEEHQNRSSNLGTLGKIGDIPIPGVWNTPGKTDIGSVHQEKDGSLTWSVQGEAGTTRSISFGSTPAKVVVGADVDGSGFADAIILTNANPTGASNPPLQWHVRTDPFAPAGVSKDFEFSFGRRNDTPFFFNPDGARDLLGVVSSRKVEGKVYDMVTETVTTIALPRVALKTDKIYPIRSSAGVDNLVIIRKLEYWIIDSTGREITQGKLRTQGNIVIGNYNSSLAGDEIGIRSGRTGAVPILNPELRGATTFFPSEGVLVDAIEFAHFGPYRLSPIARFINQCSRIEDSTTPRGREFKTLTDARGGLLIQTRRLFSKLEVETDSGVVYPLTFWKSDGEKGGIWSGKDFLLSKILPLGKVVGTINDERTCWIYTGSTLKSQKK